MVYEWDHSKARANFRKHGVRFDEAVTVFDDPLAAIFTDSDHSSAESREIIVGYSIRRRLVTVSFTERRRKRMKTTVATKVKREAGLQPEYVFDYSKAGPNRFVGKSRKGTVAVMLDPDVSAVFKDDASVNAVLRSLIGSMPPVRKSARSRS